MSDVSDVSPRRRSSPPQAVARKQAVRLVKPFLDRFEDWNQRAARASAAILSRAPNDEEKSQYRADLAELRAEVEASYTEFTQVTAGQPRHSRIDDVANAFERMLSVLSRTI